MQSLCYYFNIVFLFIQEQSEQRKQKMVDKPGPETVDMRAEHCNKFISEIKPGNNKLVNRTVSSKKQFCSL